MSSPIGRTVTEGAASRAVRSRAYREERDRTRAWARIAKLVIQRRTVLGITQRQLADRAGTSYSAISRLEAGRHATHLDTLHRVFAALEADLLLGYEAHAKRAAKKERQRQLVAV
ncbi:MAG TPA: helix-turn-helix domain-containing protein [Candidatus Limnocylindria bacterium]|jgi:DNA-binding XRE family transcriptional regulator|nr:helix-turn-helix domain-containing protein [Candidatus Limnocylindria bacterium]